MNKKEYKKFKRGIYLIASTFLGFLIGFIVFGILEIYSINHGYFNAQLFSWLQNIFLVLGAIGGFFIGRVWWRIVYIENRHWRMKNKK